MAFRKLRQAIITKLVGDGPSARRDLAIASVTCASLFGIFTLINASGHLRHLLHGLHHHHVDCLLLALGLGGILSAWYAWRRGRDAAEAAQNARFVNDLLSQEVVEHRNTMAEMMRAKEVAEEASKAKSEFVANMSHELRTPLNAVIGFSEMMAGEQLGPMQNQSYLDYAEHIRDSGRHLLELINDILDLSKIESGQLELEEEHVDLVATACRAAKMIRGSGLDRHLELSIRQPSQKVCMTADLRMIRQILLNLLTNAVKFTPDGGQVTVSFAEASNGDFEITVADTGIGMTPEELKTAFERFGQVHDPMVREFEGTGLGLPLSRALAEMHGGALTLASTPGKGTRATLRLPEARRAKKADCTTCTSSAVA